MHISDALAPPGAQRSPLWFNQRIGKLTASSMKDAVDFLKNGHESVKRRDLKIAILAERMTDQLREVFVTPAMQWGTEHEQDAKDAYYERTGVVVEDCGFYDHPTIENFGASPDGLIEAAGLMEVKCPTTPKFLSWVLAGEVPAEHKPQMLAQLACTRRKWVEFVAFDPRMPEGKRLFVRRYEPKPEEIAAIEAAAERFLAEVDEMFDAICSAPA